ncbi:MAG: hypothetical protein JWM73_2893, partial [Solirubrobacterales bacterium]|nr:hypothetical protein [Solirubrobacterales bacterium]
DHDGPMSPARTVLVALTTALALTTAAAAAGQDWSAAVQPSRPAGIPNGPSGFGNLVSCAAPGQCAAVLEYATFDVETATYEASVFVDQYFGVWGAGVRAPLPARLGTPPVVDVAAASCAAVGDCTAVGSYRTASGEGLRPLVWTDESGAWQPAAEPALPAGAAGGDAVLTAVSCFVPRSCAASGRYAGGILLFSKTGGKWGPPVKVRLPADAGPSANAEVSAVSCGGRGSCSAVGHYADSSGHLQGLLLDERGGRWSQGTRIELPGDLRFGTDKRFGVALYGLSCSAPGYCSASGSYPMGDEDRGGFFISRTPSGWGPVTVAVPPAGTNATSVLPFAISCAEPAECSAVGTWDPAEGQGGAMLLRRTGGSWAQATLPPRVPGGSDRASYLSDVSCGAPGDCGAVGWAYALGALLSERDGSWAMAVRSPASAKRPVAMRSVSCPSAGHCAAAGDYPTAGDAYRPALFSRGGAPKTASPIEVRAALRSALSAPAILGPDGFVADVIVPGAGTERLVWSAGGHVIARGTQAFTRSQHGTVEVALTPEGRALLAHGGRVTAMGFGAFTPAGGRAISARRAVTLRPGS